MVKVQRYPPGTRVTVTQGRLPLDLRIVGQAGIIVQHDRRIPDRYSVQLDGEAELRAFSEDELQPEQGMEERQSQEVDAG